MNFEELKELTKKIMKNGIKINDKDYLKELYQNNNPEILFNELNEILRTCESPRLRLCYTFAYYIGFFNTYSEQNINELPNITELESYNYLRGGLSLYFKDEMKIKYNYSKVTSYNNKYSFVSNWYPRPFSTHYSLQMLLNWIYLHDEKQFNKLIFNEEHNHIFLSTLKGSIIRNFKINPNYIDWNCDDDIKLYGLFNYLMYPFTRDPQKLNLNKEELDIWRFNISLIKRMNKEKLIQIIINYMANKETKIIPKELLEIIEENIDLFYIEYDKIKILNINELNQLYSIKHCHFLSKSKLFELILKKLKIKLSKEHITINKEDWKKFIDNLDINEIKKILKLLEELKNNLKYTSELDEQIRFKKYLIDTQKYDKFDELISLCNNKFINILILK